jgi:hypothetical protein
MLNRRGKDLIACPHMNNQHDELAEITAVRFENRVGASLNKKDIITLGVN